MRWSRVRIPAPSFKKFKRRKPNVECPTEYSKTEETEMAGRKRRRTSIMMQSTRLRRQGRKGRFGRPMPGRKWDKYGKIDR